MARTKQKAPVSGVWARQRKAQLLVHLVPSPDQPTATGAALNWRAIPTVAEPVQADGRQNAWQEEQIAAQVQGGGSSE